MMISYCDADGIRLYLGDCRAILANHQRWRHTQPGGPGWPTDLLILDPPAVVDQRWPAPPNSRTAHPDQAGHHLGGLAVAEHALTAALPLLARDAHLLAFGRLLDWPALFDLLSSVATVRDVLVWQQHDRPGALWQLDRAGDCQLILHATIGAPRHWRQAEHSVLRGFAPVPPRRRRHPGEKPVALLSHLIASYCPPGGLVLDPLAGTGSTLLAARRASRHALGVELEEPAWRVAVRRLEVQLRATQRPAAAAPAIALRPDSVGDHGHSEDGEPTPSSPWSPSGPAAHAPEDPPADPPDDALGPARWLRLRNLAGASRRRPTG